MTTNKMFDVDKYACMAEVDRLRKENKKLTDENAELKREIKQLLGACMEAIAANTDCLKYLLKELREGEEAVQETDKIYVVSDKRMTGRRIFFDGEDGSYYYSFIHGDFNVNREMIRLDRIIKQWGEEQGPPPTLDDLEIIEYVRRERGTAPIKVTWAERRERLGLSIEDVADELGFYPEFVRDVEQGKEKLYPEEVQDWLAIYFPQPGQDKPEQGEVV